MRQTYAIFMLLVTLAAGLLLAGGAAVAGGNLCRNSAINGGTAVLEGSTWRMEVSEDEAAYNGPSIHYRLNHNWSQQAKRNHRWTSTAMPMDTGASTQLITVSAAVIAEGVPVLKRGDVVDVFVVPQLIDYSRGRAPVILRRVCGGRDVRCLDGLRRTREGSEAGAEVGGGYSVAGDRKLWPPLANRGRSALWGGCRGEVATVLQ